MILSLLIGTPQQTHHIKKKENNLNQGTYVLKKIQHSGQYYQKRFLLMPEE